MKCKKILAALLIVVMLASFAGCNYVDRPYGTANHGEDISGMLSSLLIIPTFVLDAPDRETQEVKGPDTIITEEPEEPEEPEKPEEPQEPEPEPDPIYTPFTSTYDANTLLSKIESLVSTMKSLNGALNSATGVSDELLANRSIKILVPDHFPLDEESDVVKAITAQYGCAVNIRRMGSGTAYTAACRRAVMTGDNVDLIYVDNSVWGDVHPFTQKINSYVNLELADELDTFTSAWTKRFHIADELETTNLGYYVASGIGAPYLLAYNKANLANATLPEKTVTVDNEDVTLRAVELKDPVEMYNARTWGAGALNELLKASTVGTNVGIASEMDALEGLDIWYGMSDYNGVHIVSTTGEANYVEAEQADKNVDLIQNWYWGQKGSDGKNYVGSFENSSAWENGSLYRKLFNYYNGSDAAKSFSFVACGPEDLGDIKEVAEQTGSDWDFVAYPYAESLENTYRTYSEEEFQELLVADQENQGDAEYKMQVHTPVAGWAGGFAVTSNCQSPSVALRVAEELTKVWKAEVEADFYAAMTEEQIARYKDMKEHMSISYMRAFAEKAVDVNAVYPEMSNYMRGYSQVGFTPGSDPDAYNTTRANYMGLKFFDNNKELAVHAMYHKNENKSIYNATQHYSWSAFMNGPVNVNSDDVKDAGSVTRILQASLMPTIMLFDY